MNQLSYETAVKLKEAGFPYDWTPDEFFYEGSPRPDLEELIERCVDLKVLRKLDGQRGWVAIGSYPILHRKQGSTPSEAVARLYLQLNKNITNSQD